MSVSGNVTGGRVDRIGSGVRDLFQGANHHHSFPLINPIAIRNICGARHALSMHFWLRTEQTRKRREQLSKLLARRGLDSARDGLKRARLVVRSLARATAAPTRKGVGIVVVIVIVSLGPLLRSFTFTEVFPRRRLKHADRRLRRLFDTHCDAWCERYVEHCSSVRKLICVIASGN